MATLSTPSMAENAMESPFYYLRQWDAYECLGCGQMLEVPQFAIMRGGHSAEPVKRNPENRLIWLELMELDHAKCSSFADVAMALDARKFRKTTIQRVRPRL